MNNLDKISEKISRRFTCVTEARDKILKVQREVIRCASLSIRAVHRGEFEQAVEILKTARKLFDDVDEILKAYPEIYYSGYLLDAQKEYAEAHITYSLIMKQPIPDPDELKIEYAPYMNGMGEAIGELRRYILDRIRHDSFDEGESVLDKMDELYCVLTSLDYPDAITRGLRRTTDIARSIIEKTRGDLTQNISQKRLEAKLEKMRLAADIEPAKEL